MNDIESYLATGKPYLKQFLEMHGVEIQANGKFICINPDHPDSNPSTQLYEDQDRFYCHGCGCHGDIYTAAGYLLGFPTSGMEFLTENVNIVLEKLGLEVQKIELTEEQRYNLRAFQAYDAAARFIRDNATYEHAEERGWSVETCKELCIGSINYNDLITSLTETGFDMQFLKEIDLARRPEMFMHTWVFTVFDERGRPVGFACRDLEWKKGSPTSKYINTSSSNPIYKKEQLLYGMHIAKHSASDGILYVTEGYPDWVSTYNYGYRNWVGIGGTAFTHKHVDLIRKLGFNKIILGLDGDKAGIEKTEMIIREILGDQHDLAVGIIQFPEDCNEPDEYLREHGNLDLPVVDAFEWQLSRIPYDLTAIEKCEKAVPIIAAEPSAIKRESMISKLSEVTGVTHSSIRADVDSRINIAAGRNRSVLRRVCKRLANTIQNDSLEDSVNAIMTAAETVQGIKVHDHSEALGAEEWVQSCGLIFNEIEICQPQTGLIRTGWERLDEHYDGGLPDRDCFIGLGGSPNVGKSALIFKLAKQIAENNEDALVLLMSIDDTRRVFIPRFLALETGMPIRSCARPTMYLDSDGWDAFNNGKTALMERFKKNLIGKDSTNGITIDFAEQFVQHFREQFPDRQIVFMLDNLHKLKTHSDEMRLEIMRFSNRLKIMSEKLGCLAIATIELQKISPTERPTLSNIREAVNIEYDTKAIWLVYQELHGYRDRATMVWPDENDTIDGYPKIKPILEVDHAKNKISAFKGTTFYKFDPWKSQLEEKSPEECMQMKDAMQAVKKRIANGLLLPPDEHRDDDEKYEEKPRFEKGFLTVD
jgi:DNA primase catalytic core